MPFITYEPSNFDYNPIMTNSLLSPTTFGWNMPEMWVPSFAADPWPSADLTEFPAGPSMDYDEYFNEIDDSNNAS